MRYFWAVYIAAVIASGVILFALAGALNPAPPRTVHLATGPDGGAYAAAGDTLAAFFAAEGLRIETRATSGSVENLELLRAGEVDAAVVQGGIGIGSDQAPAVALASLFYEPLWVFVRAGAPVADLRDLTGLRVAVGPQGSGTRALATALLEENAVRNAELVPESGAAAAEALLAGELDAAAFVTTADRPFIMALTADPRVELLSFARADAYGRRHAYLSPVTLPRGAVNLAADAPAADVALITSAANLVVRPDLHLAVQSLLLQAASAGFGEGDVFAAPGEFPRRDLVTFELSREAERYFDRGGPSFLRQYLPFWAATLIDRLWVLAIPALTLLYPVFKSAPSIYRWQIQEKIVKWYADLTRLEHEGCAATSPEVKARVRAELADIMRAVRKIDVPLPYNDDLYRLRGHIRLVDSLVADTPAKEPSAGE